MNDAVHYPHGVSHHSIVNSCIWSGMMHAFCPSFCCTRWENLKADWNPSSLSLSLSLIHSLSHTHTYIQNKILLHPGWWHSFRFSQKGEGEASTLAPTSSLHSLHNQVTLLLGGESFGGAWGCLWQEQWLCWTPPSAATFHSHLQFPRAALDARTRACCRFVTALAGVGVGVHHGLLLLGKELHNVDSFALKLWAQGCVFVLKIVVEALEVMKPCFHFALARGLAVHLEDTREEDVNFLQGHVRKEQDVNRLYFKQILAHGEGGGGLRNTPGFTRN